MRTRERSKRSMVRSLRVAAVTTVVAVSVSLGGTALAADTSTTTAPAGGWPKVDQPGVTDTEIHVGGVTSKTNPLGGLYDTAFDGVKAYFDMVNAEGGIYGRKLKVTSERDDQIGKNKQEVQALLDQDNVFAVLPIATILSFSGSDLLQQAGVPTFGWNINDDWRGKNALFANAGALCLDAKTCPGADLPWLAQKLGKHRVGVLAYNVPNSADCADQIKTSFDKFGKSAKANLVFVDKTLNFGVSDLSADVQNMVNKKVDFVTTCMDTNGVLTLAKEMQKQGMGKVTQYLPNGYDQDFMKTNGAFFQGSVVRVPFAPFEVKPAPAGLAAYRKWMKRANSKQTENSVYGWVNADELVTGLKAAGPNFTRQKVIDALNQLKTYDAQGLIPSIDWTTQHTETHTPLGCAAIVKVGKGGKFQPVLGKTGKPFICFKDGASLSKVPKNPNAYQ